MEINPQATDHKVCYICRFLVREADVNGSSQTILLPGTVLDILREMSDEDCQAIGLDPKFSRPEWMVRFRLKPSLELFCCNLRRSLTL